ncbi:MAG TPA: helix-turn-helix transcriptional regulator [Terriglobia bacterium]|nr:helix-turn-helix transcriptional regulator [Terriglobia bacterium]
MAAIEKLEFAKKLKAAREAAGLSQDRAVRLGSVSFSAWAQWERGSNLPMLKSAGSIVLALGKESAFLFEWMGFSLELARKLAATVQESNDNSRGTL